MRIHHTLINVPTITASSNATGYGSSNLAIKAIRRAWRSTTGGSQTVTLDLGSAKYIEALWLQETNIVSATLSYSQDNTAYTALGSFTFLTEHNGRVKSVKDVKVTARYLKITISSGSPAEGYWTIGTAYVFAAVQAMPINPTEDLRWDVVHPSVIRPLPNGRVSVARTGTMYTQIKGDFQHFPTQDVGVLLRLAFAQGVIGIDLELTDRPTLKWPMEYVDDGYGGSVESLPFDKTAFVLHEAV